MMLRAEASIDVWHKGISETVVLARCGHFSRSHHSCLLHTIPIQNGFLTVRRGARLVLSTFSSRPLIVGYCLDIHIFTIII